MHHHSVFSKHAPAPTGPYSPAIVWDRLVFISGQGPRDPQTGKPINGDIAAQTTQVLANIDVLLQEAGSSRDKILKVNIYLAHVEDFSAMNAAYREFFGSPPFPARTTIQAGALPSGLGLEVDVVAYRAEG